MVSPRLAASLLIAAALVGCAPDVLTLPGTPAAPDAGATCSPAPPDGTGSVTFAATRFYLGDTRRDGTSDPKNAWKTYGFDLDGKTSTPASTDLCQPKLASAKKLLYQDGEGGLDNAFGAAVLPIFSALQPGFGQGVNDALAQGGATLLLDLEKLGPAADQAPIAARAYRGGALGAPPQLDGTDAWPVRAASLADPADPSTALERFPASSLCHDTWASGLTTELTLDSEATGVQLQLHVHHARLAMDLDAGHDGAGNGTIGGILDPHELLHDLFVALLTEMPELCTDEHVYDSYQSLRVQLEEAADILLDGTQDPQVTCDGISIGLGFDAHRAQLGPVDTTPAPAPPCPVP